MLERQWPKLSPKTRRPVIILELRGRNNIGATLTEVLLNFYDKIKKADGRFYLTERRERSYASFSSQVASQASPGMQIRKKCTAPVKAATEGVKKS